MQKPRQATRARRILQRKFKMIDIKAYSGIWDWICKTLGTCS